MSTTVEIPEPPRSAAAGKPFVATFLDHLVAKKIVPKEIASQLTQEALLRGNKSKKTLVDVLIEDFKIESEVLFDEVAQFYSFRILKLGETNARRLGPHRSRHGRARTTCERLVRFRRASD